MVYLVSPVRDLQLPTAHVLRLLRELCPEPQNALLQHLVLFLDVSNVLFLVSLQFG